MDRWSGRVGLVTGAATGIGAAICMKLTEHGINVIGCDINTEKLNEVANEISRKYSDKFKPVKCDMRIESDIKELFDTIKVQYGRIDICINNAGVAYNAPLISGSTEQWNEMLTVNILAYCICTREAVQLMLKKNINDGQIIHISSMGGHRMHRDAAIHFYSATRFAIRSLAEGLRQEMRELKIGIRVSSISPGFVESDFIFQLYADDPKKLESYISMECLKPNDVAQVVHEILKMPQHVEINDVLLRPTNQGI